jgi:hypothetical protein
MRLLADAKLRPLKDYEIVSLLIKDEVLKNKLKGLWFYMVLH